MNPVTKILSGALSKINQLINSLDNSTISMIRQGYFFLIFLFIVAAIIIGALRGKESARIKEPPLAPNVKHVFERDIYQSRDDGYFQKMLEGSQVKEKFKGDELKKIREKSKEKLMPEFDDSILDSKNNSGTGKMPEMKIDNRPLDFNSKNKNKTDVEKLKKNTQSTHDNKSTTTLNPAEKKTISTKRKTNIPKQILSDDGVLDN